MSYVRETGTRARLSKSIDERAETAVSRPIHQSGLDALLTWAFYRSLSASFTVNTREGL
jgi:hypothetical protein